MAGFTITYFPLQGRSESFRLLLADQGAEWKDEYVSMQEWMSGQCDLKKTALFGQVPKFTDDDFVLYQSNAILRYLGRKYDLYGKNDKEAALIDMVNDGVEDIWLKFVRRLILSDFEAEKEKYVADLPNQFCHFECILAKNSGGFLVGDQVSYADYNLFQVLNIHLVLGPDCLNAFPQLKEYFAKMNARPKIKAYKATDAYKNRPTFGKR